MFADDKRHAGRQPIDVIMQVDQGSRWLRFDTPARVVETCDPRAVVDVLRDVEDLTRQSGYHAAGFLTYEAGAAFELATRSGDGALPLAWFALFDGAHVREIDAPSASEPFEIGPLRPSNDWSAFNAAYERIRTRLADGDSYQVNYTWHLEGSFHGDPHSFFAELVAAQQGRYSALFRIGTRSICSASPELFFARDGLQITARPMKGTAARGRSVAEDDARARDLQVSVKERAENVMVVDMIRNDLGRIADTGSVEVRHLFAVERYPTLWQMTSEVTARTHMSLPDIFTAMYPSASITGAPKVRTMQIIKELEGGPRGVYTGAIGHVAPDGTAQFSVAIRTAVIDHESGRLTFGIGSGIVWDSVAAREYEECLLKAEVLRRRTPPFDLLETLRWTPRDGYFLLERHLHRLESSARYFGMDCPREDVRRALDRAVATSDRALKVRLLLGRAGRVRTECARLDPDTAPTRVSLAATPIDPADVFLFHKTTNRPQHEQAQRTLDSEALLWNPQGQVTESTSANIVVEIAGALVTPPVSCGLLAGTFRAELLEREVIHEAPVTVDELRHASRFWLINSVREWRAAALVASRSIGR